MSDFAVELRDVVKTFQTPEGGSVNAVDHVNMQITNGEFFSLLGSSGCGKTTSLRMMAGFEWPTAGEVYIEGQAQGHKPPFQRPVNTVFQSYALFQHLTVFQNVAFGLEMEKAPKKEITSRVGRALEMVKLTGMDRRSPRQLSGGQQQRVALARALVKLPSVLLLDEPLGALDLKLRKEMQLELKTLQREVGITFVFVTHDQEEALTMSDRIAVMSHGKVLQVGAPPRHAVWFVAEHCTHSPAAVPVVRQAGRAVGHWVSLAQALQRRVDGLQYGRLPPHSALVVQDDVSTQPRMLKRQRPACVGVTLVVVRRFRIADVREPGSAR